MTNIKDFSEKFKTVNEALTGEDSETIKFRTDKQVCQFCGDSRTMMYREFCNEHMAKESFHCPGCGESYSVFFHHEQGTIEICREDESWIKRLHDASEI